MSDKSKANGSLVAVPIDWLFEGAEIQEDVYNANASRLIIRHGSKLNDGDIQRIKKLNEGSDTIYVSNNTYKVLAERIPVVVAESLSEAEESTGYNTIKDDTYLLLDEISHMKSVHQDALLSVSAELSHRLEVTSPATILTLINALAPVDEYLQRHCVNVSLLNGLIGRWLGLSKTDIDKLVLIGLLHDCGKALVPPQVLNAPRKLTLTEFEVIKMHPVYAYDLLAGFPEDVRLAARRHHEKVNGEGYPDHLSSAGTLTEARITAVSDIYDAMVSQRAYKKPRSPFSIMAMLIELEGSELDADLVSVFNKNMPQELINKAAVMSDGSIGIIRSFDPDDIEYPLLEINGNTIKSNSGLYCTSMYTED